MQVGAAFEHLSTDSCDEQDARKAMKAVILENFPNLQM